MTKPEWMVCSRPDLMLQQSFRASARKRRLFASACCRRFWAELVDPRSRKAIEVAEAYADGRTTRKDLSIAQKQAIAAKIAQSASDLACFAAHAVVCACSYSLRKDLLEVSWSALLINVREARGWDLVNPGTRSAVENANIRIAIEREAHTQVAMIREVFGNPYENVIVERAWLEWNGNAVTKLAQRIYNSNRFVKMPTLADKMEEAGCADVGILAHCRNAAEHFRGCWVIDTVLGQT